MWTDFDTIGSLLPEAVLAVTAAMIFMLGAAIRPRGRWMLVALVATLTALVMIAKQSPDQVSPGASEFWSSPLILDVLGRFERLWVLVVGMLFVIAAGQVDGRELTGEFYGALLLVIAGAMIVGIAGNLILLFLALELVSIPTYVLLFLGRRTRASAEATMKYFFLSILSSAILLYGFSFLYGMAGSMSLSDIHAAFVALGNSADHAHQAALAPIAFTLILAGLGFKIAAVPFHFYAPDVYQGTTNLNAGLLAVFPKIVGFVALVRLTTTMAPMVGSWGWQTFAVVSMITMTLGNVAALWQYNVRRLLAYSSIAHTGYMLIGLVVALAANREGTTPCDGIGALLLYLIVYAFASTGTFTALAWLSDEQRELDRIKDLAGLGLRRPATSFCLAIFMFSLAGIPPLAGFWGKLLLFWGAVGSSFEHQLTGPSFWFLILAVVGVLNAAISAGYYLRVVATLYFPGDTSAEEPRFGRYGSLGASVAMLTCAAVVVAVGVAPGRLIDASGKASRSAWITDHSLQGSAEVNRENTETPFLAGNRRVFPTVGHKRQNRR